MKNVLMGIGNDMRLDDGVGVYIAKQFKHAQWLVLNCQTVPENYTGKIKKINPHRLVLIDAAQLDLSPGEIRLIPVDKIAEVGVGTHALPMSIIINIMQPFVDQEIMFIGVQPERLGDGQGLSDPVLRASEQIMTVLKNDQLDKITSI